jgi:hypothetical protein
MLSDAVNAIDAVHGKGFAFQPVAKWAKYIKGPDALGGAETFNFPNCEAYFIARRFGLEK